MYKYLIKRKNKTAELVVAALFLAAIVFLIAAMMQARPVILSRIFCVAFFLLGVLLANRYLLSSFCYILNLDGLGTLTIIQKQGRKERAVCRLDLEKITAFEIVEAGRRKTSGQKMQVDPCRRYDYCATLFPTRYLLLEYDDLNEKSFLKLEAEEGFTQMLTRLVTPANFKADFTQQN